MSTEIAVIPVSNDHAEFTTIESTQALMPGYYWSATKELPDHDEVLVGDALLLMEVIEFEGKVHSVNLRRHPRHGEGGIQLLIQDFLDVFIPCPDGEAIRQREQAAVMEEVGRLQQELVDVQANPQLMMAAISADVEKGIGELEKQSESETKRVVEKTRERQTNLAKIHRRAARRSEVKGNPLVAPRAALASDVGTLIGAGINEQGVLEMRKVAQQQAVVAGAQANWLRKKTDGISTTLRRLTPYITERAAVALARSSGAMKMAERIKRGIESLDLYIGTGVDVFDIRTGEPAPESEPLTLIQGKRYAEEEFATWADVSATFDFQNKREFFEELGRNDDLLNQVLPKPRCVVSVAMLRRTRDYGSPAENLMFNLQNQLVFLLVRNGQNVHVVYSSSPSHEGAPRLFPTKDELERPFRGIDGSRIGIRDVEFGDSMKHFDSIDLCYRRFLILLCGLDHRLGLLGRFYPDGEQMQFMTAGFQERHMRFVADEDSDFLLGESLPDFSEWMTRMNLMLQSGSRVFLVGDTGGLRENCPELKRRDSLKPVESQFGSVFVAQREGNKHYITITLTERYSGRSGETCQAKVWLDDSEGRHQSNAWWVCLDGLDVSDVRRYRHSRLHRAAGVTYLRLMRRLEAYLDGELQSEAAARDYLLSTAVAHGGMSQEAAQAALPTAVRNWRAARRGAALPAADDVATLNQVLSLMVPEGHVSTELDELLSRFIAESGVTPLLLTRTGKSRIVLYVAPEASDKAPYPDVLTWGWVRRISLEVGKRKLKESSSSLVWLGTVLPASEVELRRWDGLQAWLNEEEEPLPLRRYGLIPDFLSRSAEWEPVLRAGPGAGIPDSFFERLEWGVRQAHHDHKGRLVADLMVCIPVAAYSRSGRKVNIAYMTAHAESVLCTYGNAEQRAKVAERFISRYQDKKYARTKLAEKLVWTLRSREVTDLASLIPHDRPAGPDVHPYSAPSWAVATIQVNGDSMWSFQRANRKQRREHGPYLRDSEVRLSLNHAFDELTGFAPKQLMAAFKKAKLEKAKEVGRFSWSLNEGETREMREARDAAERAAILAGQYEHPYRYALSPMAGSGRSKMASLFQGPLHRKAAS